MTLKVIKQPDERLRKRSLPVTVFDAAVAELFGSLEQAMLAGPGGVGIAAPQVAILKRMVVVDCRHAQRPCKHHGLLCMANPEIIERSEKEDLGREGCLSVPEWVGVVPRARRIAVRYQDVAGEWREISAKGFEARVIQHELDHLDGILFIDRVVSTRDLVRRAAHGE